MKYLIDSNVIIALVANSDPGVVERAGQCDAGEIVTSAIAYGEVLYGARHGKPPAEIALDAFLEETPVLPFDQSAAQVYATLPFRRHSYDRLIAAHALSLGLILVTDNRRDFSDIASLRIENWFRPLQSP